MNKKQTLATAFGLLILAACGGPAPDTNDASGPSSEAGAIDALPDGLFLETPPADAPRLSEARDAAKVGENVTFQGYIGGRAEPFTEGRAVFLAVDAENVPACDPNRCKVPWDACCVPGGQIAANSATVQVVDKEGKLLGIGLNGAHGLVAGAAVTVVGKVREANENVFIVDAAGLAVRKQ